MKYVDEYRDRKLAEEYVSAIKKITTKNWTIMEVCGGQTHAILKSGIDEMLPSKINLIHGPGCPVCVTSLELIDKAIAIAEKPHVVFCSFGDMLRVPGSSKDLLTAKAKGADVRIVYSPLDAVKLAQKEKTEVVFFAVGFETTAPPNAFALKQAKILKLKNFSTLISHVLVIPAMEAILSSPANRVQAYLAAGHVSTVIGYDDYESLTKKYKVPIVVTGFEPVDILQGLFMAIKQLEEGRADVENQYSRSVTREGNIPALNLMKEIFEITDRNWRGIGNIPKSGFKLKKEYEEFDAEKRFKVAFIDTQESKICISGLVLQGIKKPNECPAFAKECTPEHPLGATMVSSEGACSAYYSYK